MKLPAIRRTTWLALPLLSLLALAGCAKQADERPSDAPPAGATADPVIQSMRARGNEPFWSVDLSESAVVMTTPEGETRWGAPVLDKTFDDGAVLFVATGEAGEIAVKVLDRTCTDTMTGMPYPQSVRVRANGQELQGCGGESAAMLQGAEWTVDEIDSKALVNDSKITLNFGSDGALSGSSSCNRLVATYTLTGEGLSISQGAGTMMACEPPVMEQESAFLGLLSAVSGFGVADDGALLLKTADGKTIRARR